MLFGFKNLLLVIAIIVMSGTLLHAVIPHDHPEEIFGTGIQAALHSEDKKWWLLLLLSFFIALGGLLKNGLTHDHSLSVRRPSFWLTFGFSKILDPIREALRMGILHPKLYE